MNKLSALAAASAALTLMAAPATAEERPRGEAKLAQMLEGRVAGEPERCIRLMGSDPLTIIDGAALVAKRGDTIWVNRTANPDSLDDDDRMTIRKTSASQLCRLDQITTSSRAGNFFTGVIFLEDFVPYRREG
ncbi:hypothetical protein A9995_06095 [Erythrobacter sp. QSSC1-22B]|uniref:hypothetical protein n=1 Tax=Erythrobacter sp. QSSC1-22B TaxID=1860125 RepID=UPI000804E8FF|nr:hypothetical protein [Erythrobacter sp. QSSC1-22B]OBX19342.1 hypothetical protein A9995_06095 [Erythrobacter sp. QSSC1-22B]